MKEERERRPERERDDDDDDECLLEETTHTADLSSSEPGNVDVS